MHLTEMGSWSTLIVLHLLTALIVRIACGYWSFEYICVILKYSLLCTSLKYVLHLLTAFISCWLYRWFAIIKTIVYDLLRCGFPVNSLWSRDTIWRQRSGSTLAQVMAFCLTARSHYLNQCWLIISKVEWHSSKGKFTRDTSAINLKLSGKLST